MHSKRLPLIVLLLLAPFLGRAQSRFDYVNDLSALSNRAPSSVNLGVAVLGQSTAYDGKGAVYVWSAGSSASVDGTNVVGTATGVAGRWILAFPGPYPLVPDAKLANVNGVSPTVYSLLSDSSNTNYSVVSVLGYYSPGDGGGGLYFLTNSIAGTNIYGGRLAATASSSWQLVPYLTKVNAKQFGARSDTNYDSAPQINAALSWARTNRTGLVIPSGTYRTDSSLDARSNSSDDFGGLTGDGMNKTVIQATFSNSPIVRVTGRYQSFGGFTSKYLNMQGSSDTNSLCLQFEDWVYFSDFDNVLVENGYIGIGRSDGDNLSQDNDFFSGRVGTVRCLNNYYAGIVDGIGTGCVWENVYISAQGRPYAIRALELTGKFQETFLELNIEQTKFRDCAIMIRNNSDNIKIVNLHTEGDQLYGSGSVSVATDDTGNAGAFIVYGGKSRLDIDMWGLDRGYLGSQIVTNITSSGATCTVLVDGLDANNSTSHGLLVGDTVVITGASPSTYNGTFTVASIPSDWSFTYVAGGVPASSPATVVSGSDYITVGRGSDAGVSTLVRTVGPSGTVRVQTMRIRDQLVIGASSAVRASAYRLFYPGGTIPTFCDVDFVSTRSQSYGSSWLGTMRMVGGERSGGVGTWYTKYPHELTANSVVFVAGASQLGGFNGLYTVTNIPSPFSFQATLAGTTATTAESTAYIVQRDIGTATRSRSSNLATITTSEAHFLKRGHRISIGNMGGTGYDDTETVVQSVPNNTSFTYTSTGSDEGSTTSTNGLIMLLDAGISGDFLTKPSTDVGVLKFGYITSPFTVTSGVNPYENFLRIGSVPTNAPLGTSFYGSPGLGTDIPGGAVSITAGSGTGAGGRSSVKIVAPILGSSGTAIQTPQTLAEFNTHTTTNATGLNLSYYTGTAWTTNQVKRSYDGQGVLYLGTYYGMAVLTKTTNYTVSYSDSTGMIQNSGGSAQTNTLPAGATGLNYTFKCGNVAGITIKCNGAQQISFHGSSTTATTGDLQSVTLGSTVQLVWDGTLWQQYSDYGTWVVH